ncbi:MAG: hypothetical protein LC769_03915, partial [Chloroflexi bacterium]|nr:hypothetical protein [Chloroflexota bacterium]
MRQRGVIALVVVVLGVGLLAVHTAAPTQAASSARITNVSVEVSGATVTYHMCLLAPSEPLSAAVTVSGPGGTKQPALVYSGQRCGQGTYYLKGSIVGSLPAGSYQFQAACALLNQDPVIPCLTRHSGLVANFSGVTVPNQCQVDFDPSVSMRPVN